MLTFTFIQGHIEDMTYFKIVFIGEWGIFGAKVFLCYSRFFIKGNFVIGGVECIRDLIPCHITMYHTTCPNFYFSNFTNYSLMVNLKQSKMIKNLLLHVRSVLLYNLMETVKRFLLI